MGRSACGCEDGEDLGLAAQPLLLGLLETSENTGGRGEDQPGVASLGCPCRLYTSAPEFMEPAALDEISLQPDEF